MWFAVFLLALILPQWPAHAQTSSLDVEDIEIAATQGDAEAQTTIGAMYQVGHGVRQDYAEAVKWYRLAADQGVVVAQYNLGLMHAKGQGVPQDFVQAHFWFNIAASQGHKGAAKNRDLVASLMTRDQIAEAQRLARDWFESREQ